MGIVPGIDLDVLPAGPGCADCEVTTTNSSTKGPILLLRCITRWSSRPPVPKTACPVTGCCICTHDAVDR
jgi:hypothetical protein